MAHQTSTLLPVLAQLDILTPPPSLPSLPDPPMLSHALFENPIPLVILVVALGLAAYTIAARLDRRRIGLAAIGVAAVLGVGLVALSRAIETDRERVQAQTRALVAAVAEADGGALDRMLSPDARLYARSTSSGWDKGAIIDWIETTLGPGGVYEVEAHHVREVQAEIGPSGRIARTRARVTVTPVESSPLGFVCMMTWQETEADEWRLLDIEPLWLQGWGEISQQTMRDTPRWD
ncbi:hypothetical protein MNBD_PLANCTO03-701 [hydrothermal vent metagenome]|uniref:DUF4440 domain-containing protein n=1 Tax=hydrothermal vent metagenome TaxID=652676 RepID=A0A3B1DYW1_9ZZZZ